MGGSELMELVGVGASLVVGTVAADGEPTGDAGVGGDRSSTSDPVASGS